MDKVVKIRWETKIKELEAERDGLTGLPSAQQRVRELEDRIRNIKAKIGEVKE